MTHDDAATGRFFRSFMCQRDKLARAIGGVGDESEQMEYAALTMIRLVFIYFVQHKGFMDDDQDYLRNRLVSLTSLQGQDTSSHNYYQDFLIPLFQVSRGENHGVHDPMIRSLIGDIPTVGGGIFSPTDRELADAITIPDAVFVEIFDVFDSYSWTLADRCDVQRNEINPDVFGHILEQFINQKQMGAYYTHEDVTRFITRSTLLPVILTKLDALGIDLWALTVREPQRYIWGSMRHGQSAGQWIGFPDEIEAERGLWPRRHWLEKPDATIALPGETWWEVDFRHTTCDALRTGLTDATIASVDEAVTANIDLETLVLDAIGRVDDPMTAIDVWLALTDLRVIDPTCGSGAFLLVEVEMLLPIYEAALAGLRAHQDVGNTQVDTVLKAAANHPNDTYFLVKHVILNNIFGVDIMEDAVDVARLRLLLRLVAAIDDKSDLETLPDLRLTIRHGNILVGALTMGDIDTGSEPSSPHDDDLGEDVRRLDGEYSAVRAAWERDDSESQHAADHLVALLDETRDAVNHSYFLAHHCAGAYDRFLATHHPFHWFIEFPEIIHRGGFDVVISNPPYIRKRDVTDYDYAGFMTDDLPDIYAPCTERASQITHPRGRLSLIVPISCSFSEDYATLRTVLADRFPHLWVSTFSRNPAALFDTGLGVRSTILVGGPGDETRLHVTKTHRWHEAYRPALFETLHYTLEPDDLKASHGWVRVPSDDVGQVLTHATRTHRFLGEIITATGPHTVGFKKVSLYWLSAYLREAPVYTRQGVRVEPTTGGWLHVANEDDALLVLATLTSKLAFVWWYCTGDDFNTTVATLKALPINPTVLPISTQAVLKDSARALLEALDDNTLFTPYAKRYMGTYLYSQMREITDQVDLALAQALGYEDLLPALEHAYACVYKQTGERPGTFRFDPFKATDTSGKASPRKGRG